MSLLMDALKKAEEEKKKTLEQIEVVDNLSVTGNDEKEVPAKYSTKSFSEDLTLENTVSNETIEQTDELNMDNVSAPFDDTFNGVLFEDEQEVDVYEETLPDVPADQLARDLAGGEFQPTPVAAQTVFSAGKGSAHQNSFTWSVFVVLALLAVGSFSILYYFTLPPVTQNLPSPIVARGIESSLAPLPGIIPIVDSEVVSGTIISSEIEEQQFAVVEEEMVVQPVSSEINLTGLAESDGGEENIKNETGNENNSAEVDGALLAVELPQGEIGLEEVKRLPHENIQTNPSLITISKNKAPKQENMMVTKAFKAYEGGHYDAAKSIYHDVLKTDPDNRDAHLGLAAIAINGEDRESAYFHYIHILELNPADTLALNALISLSNSSDPVTDESAIKVLIQQEGDLPYLYFSLGNLYAKQLRWADAQQAFFDAYRLDTTNPDYVLNLAISLDQIGEYDTALDFYKTAIDLSQNSYARFDFTSVNSRIHALSKIVESKL